MRLYFCLTEDILDSPDALCKNTMSGSCSTYGEEKGVYRILAGKPEGKRPLGRTRHRWEDNIKMDFKGSRMRGMDWIALAQDRDRWRAFVHMVMNLRVQQNAGNFLTS